MLNNNRNHFTTYSIKPNLHLSPVIFTVDMEAAMESAGDVRHHPAHRGHQAPGR